MPWFEALADSTILEAAKAFFLKLLSANFSCNKISKVAKYLSQ